MLEEKKFCRIKRKMKKNLVEKCQPIRIIICKRRAHPRLQGGVTRVTKVTGQKKETEKEKKEEKKKENCCGRDGTGKTDGIEGSIRGPR